MHFGLIEPKVVLKESSGVHFFHNKIIYSILKHEGRGLCTVNGLLFFTNDGIETRR